MSKDTDSKYEEILHFLQNDASEEVAFSLEGDGIHMKVSSLSPFAIIQYFNEEETNLPVEDVPKTGDTGRIGLCILLAVLSCGAMTSAILYDRKRRRA